MPTSQDAFQAIIDESKFIRTPGPYNKAFNIALAYNTLNQLIINTPGSNLSIFLQSLTMASIGADGPVELIFGWGTASVVSQFFAYFVITATGSETMTFPGGLELPANNQLLVSTIRASAGTALTCAGTYATAGTV